VKFINVLTTQSAEMDDVHSFELTLEDKNYLKYQHTISQCHNRIWTKP